MAQGYFVAPMTCPYCGDNSDGSNLRLSHHLLATHGATIGVGDRVPVSPHILPRDFVWVRRAEPDEALHLLKDGACRACGSELWVELVVEAGILARVDIVAFERDVLARQHWVTDEVWTRFTFDPPAHGRWAALVRSLPGDADVPELSPLEVAVDGAVVDLDTAESGPVVVVPDDEPRRALASRLQAAWQSGREDDPALAPALEHLRAVQRAWDVPDHPVLFSRAPTSDTPHPADEALLNALEAEAERLDAADAAAEVGAEPSALLEMRRAFLVRLKGAGLFDDERREARGRALATYFASRVRTWFLAYEQLRAWGLAGSAADPLDGPVSIDYARLQLWPKGADGGAWAARATPLLDGEDGDQGFVVEHAGGGGVRAWWRRDAGRPALLALERLAR